MLCLPSLPGTGTTLYLSSLSSSYSGYGDHLDSEVPACDFETGLYLGTASNAVAFALRRPIQNPKTPRAIVIARGPITAPATQALLEEWGVGVGVGVAAGEEPFEKGVVDVTEEAVGVPGCGLVYECTYYLIQFLETKNYTYLTN